MHSHFTLIYNFLTESGSSLKNGWSHAALAVILWSGLIFNILVNKSNPSISNLGQYLAKLSG